MSRKKMRKIYDWKKEMSNRKRAGLLSPAAPLAFRAKRNKRENKHTIIAEELSNIKPKRRGGQWKGQVKIASDFDEIPEGFPQ